jgi:hypothetical protein
MNSMFSIVSRLQCPAIYGSISSALSLDAYDFISLARSIILSGKSQIKPSSNSVKVFSSSVIALGSLRLVLASFNLDFENNTTELFREL